MCPGRHHWCRGVSNGKGKVCTMVGTTTAGCWEQRKEEAGARGVCRSFRPSQAYSSLAAIAVSKVSSASVHSLSLSSIHHITTRFICRAQSLHSRVFAFCSLALNNCVINSPALDLTEVYTGCTRHEPHNVICLHRYSLILIEGLIRTKLAQLDESVPETVLFLGESSYGNCVTGSRELERTIPILQDLVSNFTYPRFFQVQRI